MQNNWLRLALISFTGMVIIVAIIALISPGNIFGNTASNHMAMQQPMMNMGDSGMSQMNMGNAHSGGAMAMPMGTGMSQAMPMNGMQMGNMPMGNGMGMMNMGSTNMGTGGGMNM
ncbi:MAG TPA: hypothetical protein VEC37_03535, partial [Bacillota bacterium]|nr:hypothetical protein [Bacillota bacterium]